MKSVRTETHQGSFKDFPLEDLLMLVAQQKRTGILHLSTSDDRAIDVTFRDGRICKAKRYRPKARELFGNLLVEARLITEQQRARAVDEQRRTLKQLGEILVESGALTREALRDFAALQTQEALYQPFEWSEGTWKFVEMEVGRDFESLPPLDCAAAIQEGRRRRANWPALRRRFNSEAMTFRRAKGLPPPGSPELLKLQKKGITLGAKERRAYALAEPGLPLSSIVALSKLGEFEALLSLANLCEGGFLKFGAEGHADGTRGRQRDLRAVANQALACLVLLCLAILLIHLAHQRRAGQAMRTGEASPRELIGQAQRQRIAGAIEAYRILHGALPESLDALVAEGLLWPGEERYPFETRYGYSPQPESAEAYLLLLPLR